MLNTLKIFLKHSHRNTAKRRVLVQRLRWTLGKDYIDGTTDAVARFIRQKGANYYA